MGSGAPWSVKGINPKAREVAKELARRSGMTLGEWLNRVILEDDVPEEAFSEADVRDLPRRPQTDKIRLAAPQPGARGDDLSRVAHALDRLAQRIETSETRTGLAITGIEHSVRHAVARIETSEREQLAVAARLDAVVERLEAPALTDTGPRAPSALEGLYEPTGRAPDLETLTQELMGRLGQRLADAEQQTALALDRLGGALADLDRRLAAMEGGSRLDLDRRMEALAAELAEQVEQARIEAAAGFAGPSAGRLDERLAQMADQVRAAEQRQAHAIGQMGREVLSLAEALNRRLSASEQASGRAIEQVGDEMARVGASIESRLYRAEQVQADALETLGTEITRVTERLTERIVASERRAAEAIGQVGDQVARVTERMEQRHERLSEDLTERLRQSEARTERLLDEARQRLEERLAQARARIEESAPVFQAAPEAEEEEPPPVHAFGPELFARAETAPIAETFRPETTVFGPDDFTAADADEDKDEDEALAEAPAGRHGFDDEDLYPAAGFAPIPDHVEPIFEAETDLDEGVDESPISTREVIEQARAAARAAEPPQPRAVFQERREPVRPAPRRVFGRLNFRAQARPQSTWQTALVVAGGAAFLSVAAAGVVLMEGQPQSQTEGGVAVADSGTQPPRAAVALTPGPLGPTTPQAGQAPAPPSSVAIAPAPRAGLSDYAAAVRDLEAGQPGGLARLKGIADQGFAPAQFYLAKLYETGQSGVAKSPAEARRWTQSAADGGERSAMHNLALYYFRGEGGAQDLTQAARWFRKAAEAGVVDSQFNLGLLYQSGSGVEKDPAEAYKWFSIAANGGDAQARANAIELEGKLSREQLAGADRAVAGFRPTATTELSAQAAAPASATLSTAQRILGKLGYYAGPMDGSSSPKLTLALQAYQRDHGLATTGALDPSTISKLSTLSR
jgi:localization factor PodJL